jgi:L-asparaginase/Glu-tRNA(Gln) amidotransferase subunit D
LDPRVVLVKQHPAMTVETLRRFLEGASGAVLEGTGAGHIRDELQEVIASFGRPVVMSTQAIYGGIRWGLYATDQVYLDTKNVIPAWDMTSEAALVKLMWALRQPGDVRSTMLRDVAGELTEGSV